MKRSAYFGGFSKIKLVVPELVVRGEEIGV